MASTPKTRRRWFQFSLRSLLGLMTLVVGLLVAWRALVGPYQGQRETMKLVERLGGSYKSVAAERWLRRVYGQDFQHVTLVDLADCDKPGEYMDRVVRLPRLETLLVGGPEFTDEQLVRLRWMKSLRALVLDSTAVSDEAVAALKEALPELMVQISHHRAIATVNDAGGKTEPYLNIAHRRLVGLIEPMHFWQITAADFDKPFPSYPRFGDAELAILASVPLIEDLRLRETRITDAGLCHLRRFSRLRVLWLRGTAITDAGVDDLRALTTLTYLDLGDTKITDAGIAALQPLQQLRGLALNHTQVTDKGVAQLKQLPNLEHLTLDFTNITDNALVHLRGMPQLKVLFVRETKVTRRGVEDLQRALPACRIYRLLPILGAP
jgi:internalin A